MVEQMTDLEILRMVLSRELETINEYSALARQAQDPTVRNLLLHISRDEEEHVAECFQWICKLNPVVREFMNKPLAHIEGPLHVSAGVHIAGEPLSPESSSQAAHAGVGPKFGFTTGGFKAVIGSDVVPSSLPLGGTLITPQGLTVGSLIGSDKSRRR